MTTRDPQKPLFHWYVDCVLGKELVFALYTLPCRYGMCAFCSLPQLSEGGEQVTAEDIERQVDHVLGEYDAEQLSRVAKVSIYTAASSLDQVCLPTQSLKYLALRATDLPALKMLSLETRPEYVEDRELQELQEILGPDVVLEIGIGYETHDPYLRNKVLGKGLSERALRALMGQLAAHGAHLKAYVMLKPHHTLTERGGIEEAIAGLKHLHGLGQEFGVPTAVHLNPTYMAEGCSLTVELRLHEYQPPELSSVIEVVKAAEALSMAIYLGLDDEGLAVDEGTFRSTGLDRARTVAALQAYNRHQDFDRFLAETEASQL